MMPQADAVSLPPRRVSYSALLLLTLPMAFLEVEMLSFLPNFATLFAASSSASSSGTAQKIVNNPRFEKKNNNKVLFKSWFWGALSKLQQQEVLEEAAGRRDVALSTAGAPGRGCALILVSKGAGKHMS